LLTAGNPCRPNPWACRILGAANSESGPDPRETKHSTRVTRRTQSMADTNATGCYSRLLREANTPMKKCGGMGPGGAQADVRLACRRRREGWRPPDCSWPDSCIVRLTSRSAEISETRSTGTSWGEEVGSVTVTVTATACRVRMSPGVVPGREWNEGGYRSPGSALGRLTVHVRALRGCRQPAIGPAWRVCYLRAPVLRGGLIWKPSWYP
jgi:hypothetical protein